jgi:hypothetical protein
MLRFNIFQLASDLQRLHDAILRKRGAVIEVVRARMTAVVQQLAGKIVSEKLSGDPLHRRTGILAGSVVAHAAEYVSMSKIVASVTAATPPAGYGAIQEKGVPSPYAITASAGKVLSWVTEGHRAYAASIIHPAMMNAQGWFSSNETASEDWIRAELAAALREAMKE